MDGVDIALLVTDGEIREAGRSRTKAYQSGQRARLMQALEEAKALPAQRPPGCLGELEDQDLTDWHGVRCRGFLARMGLAPGDRRYRLSWPDGPASPGRAPDRSAGRWCAAGARASACPWSMISAPPMSPPAARARRSSRSITGCSPRDPDPAGGVPQYRRGGQCHLGRRGSGIARLRLRAGQCADGRLGVAPHRSAGGCRRRLCPGPARVDEDRVAQAHERLSRPAGAEIARSRRLHLGAGASI